MSLESAALNRKKRFDSIVNLGYWIIMRDIETKLLRSFLSVASEQSVSTAAEFMDCSQGTMSLRIRSLEQQVGMKLFDRRGRRVELTGPGRDLLPAVREFVDMHDRLQQRIGTGITSASVRLGVAESLAKPMLSRLLTLIPHFHADLELCIRCQLSRPLQKKILARALDLAVVMALEQSPRKKPLARPNLRWVAAPGFTFDDRSPLPLAAFSNGCNLRDAGIRALNAAGIAYRLSVCSPNWQVVAGAVDSGLAVTLLADGTIPPHWEHVGSKLGLPRPGRVSIRIVERLGSQPEAVAAVKKAIDCVIGEMYRPASDPQTVNSVSPPLM